MYDAEPLIAGVDEAGRGCLAGPVTAAVVILDPERSIDGLNDSKQLHAKTRAALRLMIQSSARAWAVGWASVYEIDRMNILQATYLAMQRAVAQLGITPAHIVVDGNSTPCFRGIPATAIIGGDAQIPAISAASIMAKTTRDALLQRWHYLYPEYQFYRHKGYPTKVHKQAIAEYGLTPLHRKTFRLKGMQSEVRSNQTVLIMQKDT